MVEVPGGPPTALEPLLAFAAGSQVPGGFGYLDADGGLLAGKPVETWISARMTHVFSLATVLGHPGAADLAAHGVVALADGPLHDLEHGGWRAAVPAADGRGQPDDTKAAYVHAFVVLAGASATAAGIDGGRALLDDALAAWEEHFWDDGEGMAVESWDRAWTSCEDYRGINANMHGVEATLAAADALATSDPERAAVLRDRARRTTERVVHGWARAADWRLPEHFTADWTPLPEFNRDVPADPFRPFGVTPGHVFEWSRLCLHLAAALGADAPGWVTVDAAGMFTSATRRGWAADGQDGFPYTLDWSDRPVVVARMHWVLCEAIAAATAVHAVTGDPAAAELQQHWQAHGDALFLDRAVGSWHHELTPAGQVGTGTWAGKPDVYHLVQMLLLRDRPLHGSIAAALLAVPG